MTRQDWPIIVGGCHRSGTSLVRRILNAHSRIHCAPEVKFFRDFFGDYPSDPLAHARFASSARALLPETELFELLGHAFVELHERAAARAGKARWADKNPENVLYLDAWTRLLGDRWLLLHVLRNPLDTLASIRETPFRLVIPTDLPGRIDHYLRYTEAGLAFGRAHADRYFGVLYERLAEEPEARIEAIMRWAEEQFEPRQLAFNAVPQGQGLEDPKVAVTAGVHGDSVGQWTTILSREDARVIWSRTRATWLRVDPACHWLPAIEAIGP